MIYEPREDSFLLKKYIKDYVKKDLKVLDMCGGSGFLAEEAIKCGGGVIAVDIDSEAIKVMKKKGIEVIQSDLFEKVKGSFDIILCNPPYLPSNADEPKDSALATTGGDEGHEITEMFLKQAKKHLNEGGKILLIQSDLSKDIEDIAPHLGYYLRIVDEEKFFMEKITLYELSLYDR